MQPPIRTKEELARALALWLQLGIEHNALRLRMEALEDAVRQSVADEAFDEQDGPLMPGVYWPVILNGVAVYLQKGKLTLGACTELPRTGPGDIQAVLDRRRDEENQAHAEREKSIPF